MVKAVRHSNGTLDNLSLAQDDPDLRAKVHQRLIKSGADDLIEMIGVLNPIPDHPSYGV